MLPSVNSRESNGDGRAASGTSATVTTTRVVTTNGGTTTGAAPPTGKPARRKHRRQSSPKHRGGRSHKSPRRRRSPRRRSQPDEVPPLQLPAAVPPPASDHGGRGSRSARSKRDSLPSADGSQSMRARKPASARTAGRRRPVGDAPRGGRRLKYNNARAYGGTSKGGLSPYVVRSIAG